MPEVMAEVRAPRSALPKSQEPITQIRADFMSLGGGVILAIAIVATFFLIFSSIVPGVEPLQLVIIALLAMACWIYAVNRFTECFKLGDSLLEFRALLGRTQIFKLEDIDSLRLTDLGWNLNGDFFVLEVALADRRQPVQIGLGPCWHRRDLRAFVQTVGQALEGMNKEQFREAVSSPPLVKGDRGDFVSNHKL